MCVTYQMRQAPNNNAGRAVSFNGRYAAARERTVPAFDALRPAVPNATVRGFLLPNLRHEGIGETAHWRWQPNLELLGRGWSAQLDWAGVTVSEDVR